MFRVSVLARTAGLSGDYSNLNKFSLRPLHGQGAIVIQSEAQICNDCPDWNSFSISRCVVSQISISVWLCVHCAEETAPLREQSNDCTDIRFSVLLTEFFGIPTVNVLSRASSHCLPYLGDKCRTL